MKRGVLKFTACALAAGMTFTGTGAVAFASKDTTLAGLGTKKTNPEASAESQLAVEEVQEAVYDDSMNGERAFAQCEEYINIRSSADTDSDVVGKVYNNGAVTILGKQGDWYEVQSGNATGYVKADYFATGAEAEAIASEVAYNVATVYSDALTVRSDASEDAESIGTVYASDQMEVVDYDGDWMKVVLDDGTYGYVSAYYVGYDTYYSEGETLEEEEARLEQEWLDYLAQQEAEQAAAEQAYLDAIAAEQQAQWDAEYLAQEAAQQAQWNAEYLAQEAAQQAQANAEYQAQAATDAQSAADAAYQQYLEAQAAADAATQQADPQVAYDAAAQAQSAYQTYVNAQNAADAQAQSEADAAYQAQVAAAEAQAQTSYTEESYTESTQAAEETYTEPAASSAGQSIVNFATQFVGNPYVWGGTSLTNGADCSGFTQSVFANFGIGLPRTAAEQSGCGTPVDLSDIQPGDLLFYSNGGGIGHVTIYMGGGQVVHASNSSTGITISSYGYRTPVSARRYW